MITIYPSDAIIETMNGISSRHYWPCDWFMAYEWFCRRLLEWQPIGKYGNLAFEILNATSSINNCEFDPLYDLYSPRARLAYLFKHISCQFPCVDQDFLRHLKIHKWADLAKPIKISGRRPKEFPREEWFKMGGRTFKRPGPNSCHRNALFVQDFSLKFCQHNGRWSARIGYGYPHDSSKWYYGLEQSHGESLDHFADQIDALIETKLKPDENAGLRQERERTWHRIYKAVRELFYEFESVEADRTLADILIDLPGSSLTEGRIVLTNRRLATLKRWAKQSTDDARKDCGNEISGA